MFNAGFQVVKARGFKVNTNVSEEHATYFYKEEDTLTLNVETMSLLNLVSTFKPTRCHDQK